MRIHVLRLRPGQDLKAELRQFTQARLKAGLILTAVGSFTQVCLRWAGAETAATLSGKFELVSLVGTLCPEGVHLHLCVADNQGQVRGGHLLNGCVIYTTAEIILGELEDIQFSRSLDPATGHHELVIEPYNSLGFKA